MTRRSFLFMISKKPVALKMMTLQILSGLNENNADKNSKVITSSYKNRQSSLKNMSCYLHKRTCTVMYKNSTGIAHIFFFGNGIYNEYNLFSALFSPKAISFSICNMVNSLYIYFIHNIASFSCMHIQHNFLVKSKANQNVYIYQSAK